MTPPSRPPSASTVLDEADLTQLAGVKLGNDRLERLVGRGRMGVVYLAKDEALLRPTAIKILSWRVAEAQGQDPVQWLLTEARLVARINHPLVVQIHGAARHADHGYIAMEYVPGTSAETAVAQHGRMAPEAATDVLLQAASALQAAHQSAVVHRDVKPANLLMRADGVTKLGDFGMALGVDGLIDELAVLAGADGHRQSGFVPTHIQRYPQPMTGSPAADLLNSRGKRIFTNGTSMMAVRSDAPFFVQRYTWDSGENLTEVSVPVVLRGERWGTVRLAFRAADGK